MAFPNPEEPGALDLALALAASVQADVVLANDPDADRLAVAVPASGRRLAAAHGRRARRASWPTTSCAAAGLGADDAMVTTVVSSRLLQP